MLAGVNRSRAAAASNQAASRVNNRNAGFIRATSSKEVSSIKKRNLSSSEDFSSFHKDSQPKSDASSDSDSEFSPYHNESHRHATTPNSSNKPQRQANKKIKAAQHLRANYPTAITPVASLTREQQIQQNFLKRAQIQQELYRLKDYNKQTPDKPTKAEQKQRPSVVESNSITITDKRRGRKKPQLDPTISFSSSSSGDRKDLDEHTFGVKKRQENPLSSIQSSSQEPSSFQPLEGRNNQTNEKCRPKYSYQPNSKVLTLQDERNRFQNEAINQRFISQSQNVDYKRSLQLDTDQLRGMKTKKKLDCKDQQQMSGLLKTKGGVSFALNVQEFNQPEPTRQKSKTQLEGRKKKKLSSKEEILKRRQLAKNYDKQARIKLFHGFS